MEVTVTILVENTTPLPPFVGEYGFAALVTVDDKKFLFDTGSADALFRNSKSLGINLALVENLIISHGHFDHTGGVLEFLQMGSPKKVFAQKEVFTTRYVVVGDFKREISALCKEEDLNRYGAELQLLKDFTEISPGIYLTGEVPRLNEYEDVGGNFQAEIDGKMDKDLLPDDMSMVIDHPEGLIIISGCAHAGMINIIDYARKETGKDKIKAFIGGTHLIMASEERMERTIEALKSYDIEKIIPCHCTGFYSAARLYNELGNRVVKGETSMSFAF